MVKTLSGYDPKKAAESATREQEQAQAQADEIPPLLLVKVYQDNMATLMKVNAELSGSNVLLGQLATELENVNKDLASLSASEAEYGRLKRALATASAAAAHYASKMVEEQISSEVAKKSQLSSLRVVQRAVVPTDPVFPHVPHIAGLALAGGILIGLAIIFVPQVARGTMPKIRPNRDGDADDELVDLLVARRRKEASGKN
jgi:uncharacterized protein involved in exopolysaccharide biosynthesis